LSELPYNIKQNTEELANPCGLIAKYLFNDDFFQIKEISMNKAYPIDDS